MNKNKAIIIAVIIIVVAFFVWQIYIQPQQENEARIEAALADIAATRPEFAQTLADARQIILEDINENPDDAYTWYELGVNSKAIGDYLSAEDEWKKSLELNPESKLVFNNLGLMYQELEEYEKAEEMFRTMIEAHPTDIKGYLLLKSLYNGTEYKDQSDAETILKRGIAQTNGHEALLHELARLYDEIGEEGEAQRIRDALADPNVDRATIVE